MPLYFIDTVIGSTRSADLIGTVLENQREAIKLALAALLDIATDETETSTQANVHISVRDQASAEIFAASLVSHRKIKAFDDLEAACNSLLSHAIGSV